MLQVYFLLVVVNILGGMGLSSDFLKQKFPGASRFLDLLENTRFQGVCGISAFLIGFFGLFAVMKEDGIPILSNLVPSFSALVVGTGLVLHYYRNKSGTEAGLVDRLDAVILKNRAAVGVSAIVAGSLHFFFPWVVLL